MADREAGEEGTQRLNAAPEPGGEPEPHLPRPNGMRNQLSVPVTVLALLALAACGTEPGSGSGDGGGSVKTDLPLTGVHWSVDSVTVGGKKSAAPAGAHVEITDKGRAQGN